MICMWSWSGIVPSFAFVQWVDHITYCAIW